MTHDLELTARTTHHVGEVVARDINDPMQRMRRLRLLTAARILAAWGALAAVVSLGAGGALIVTTLIASALLQVRALLQLNAHRKRHHEALQWAEALVPEDAREAAGEFELEIARRQATLANAERQQHTAVNGLRVRLGVLTAFAALQLVLIVPYNIWLGWSPGTQGAPACAVTSVVLTGMLTAAVLSQGFDGIFSRRRLIARARERLDALEYVHHRALREASGGELSLAEAADRDAPLRGALSERRRRGELSVAEEE